MKPIFIRKFMTLWDLQEMQRATIKAFENPLNDKQIQRLEDLGFRIGEKVTCTKRIPFQGPRLFRSNDSIFSLAKDVAQHVLLEKPELEKLKLEKSESI